MEYLPFILLIVAGLFCLFSAQQAVSKGFWQVRGIQYLRSKNEPIFWAGVLTYIAAGILFLIFAIKGLGF
jgi:hypothetical protein